MNETAVATGVTELVRAGAVRSVFQPIVELDRRRVVAYEALARGPEGPLKRPDELFSAAREAGCLAELDEKCRAAAFRGAVAAGLLAPLTVFVNVEPEVLDTAPLDDLLRIAADAPGELRVVMEITERALAARPAELLLTVARVRELGWGVALDDVGAESMSLAFMPLLRPDVVKLDLRLVQTRPGPAIAEIMNAVNAYAEHSGALILAEGIEDESHLRMAKALGATLGQGWLFGRPSGGRAPGYEEAQLQFPSRRQVAGDGHLRPTPFSCLPDTVELRRSPKSLLIELSKQLERQAMRLGDTCLVAATFQEARHFTPSTTQRYRDLVARTGFVCALGDGLAAEPLPGLRGATLVPDDPVRGEWDLVILAPHFAAGLLARDLGDEGPDMERTFEFALTYDRDTVIGAAQGLLTRVAPRISAAPRTPDRSQPQPLVRPEPGSEGSAGRASAQEALLDRALAATTSGVSIVDMQAPDQPLIYVNRAFEQLSGHPADEVLGRNCRFLQGPDTDVAAISRMRAAIAAGQECQETLLNFRGPQRTPWWNEIHLAPVTDAAGVVVQYIGVQNDVTARVVAERALVQERDRSRSYLERIEQLAWTDPLTGLPNRRRLQEKMEAVLWNARIGGHGVALLFVDLDGFKCINDEFGHAAGDEFLVTVANRLAERLRRSDMLARLGGDEFLVALCGLDQVTAREEAEQVAADLKLHVSRPIDLAGQQVPVGASIGVAVFPVDGAEFGDLLHAADLRMYDRKRAARR